MKENVANMYMLPGSKGRRLEIIIKHKRNLKVTKIRCKATSAGNHHV